MWQMYPDDLPLPKHEEAPKGMPPIAFTYEMDGKTEVQVLGDTYPIPFPHNNSLPDNATTAMRRGYYAAVTWTDHLIGLLLNQLRSSGRDKDTVIALIGDHGWQLGERE
jgi:iduronate 2-sulfatase